jgi:hypothetical protein
MTSATISQTITHYCILEKLSGGIGMVYKAENAPPLLLPAYVRPYKTPMRCDRDP